MISPQEFWSRLRKFSPTVYDAFPDHPRVREEFKHRAFCMGELYYQVYREITGDLPREGRIVDLGAYPGTFLRLCREVFFPDRDPCLVGTGLILEEDEENYRRKADLCPGVSFLQSSLGFREYFKSIGIEFVEFNLDDCCNTGSSFPCSLDASCDVVTCIEVIEHLHMPYRLIDTLERLLKPGGVCLIETNNVANLSGILKLLLSGRSNLDFELVERYQKRMPTSKHPHTRFYSLQELDHLLTKAGLQVEALRSFSWDIPGRFLRSCSLTAAMKRALYKAFPSKQSHIFAKARKLRV